MSNGCVARAMTSAIKRSTSLDAYCVVAVLQQPEGQYWLARVAALIADHPEYPDEVVGIVASIHTYYHFRKE